MRRILPAVAAVLLLAAACTSKEQGPSGGSPSSGALSAEVASYELLSGTPNSFLVGLFSTDGTVSYGTIDMEFSYLGEGGGAPVRGPTVTGAFILVPNDDAGQPPATDTQLESDAAKAPELTQPDQVRGVYQAKGVTFDKAGYWQVDVGVQLSGTTEGASAKFAVADKTSYPAPGDVAPRSENLLYGEKGAKPAEVDSRGTDGWSSIPDKELHQITVKQAIAQHEPVVVVVSTPLYCQSRFCGPVTDEVGELAKRYGDSVAFVHIEIWKDYQKKVINKAAAQWVYRNGDVTEPWVFLVGADGKIVARWQNVLDRPELEQEMVKLIPPSAGPPN